VSAAIAVPVGYSALRSGGARAVSRIEYAETVRELLAKSTLYRWAAAQAGAEAMAGRGTAWGAVLPPDVEVVVRRNRHGGVLAALTGELFWTPRAPHELSVGQRLARLGVPTPDVLAYALYPAFAGLRRCDVMTRRLHGDDFPAAWRRTADEPERIAILDALAGLLRALQLAGAFHPDLNLKNVFIVSGGSAPVAYALDVDRVQFAERGSQRIAARNYVRVVRSARKWRGRWELNLSDAHLAYLGDAVARASAPAAP
jgi:hypothetical protein